MFYVCCRWVKELINRGGGGEGGGGRVEGLGEVNELKTEVSVEAEYGLLIEVKRI